MVSMMRMMVRPLLAVLLVTAVVEVADARTVLFDLGHGQRFLPDRSESLDLSNLAEEFQRQNLSVELGREVLTDQVLADADALVISGAFEPVKTTEVDAILRFVARGGKLAVMLHIGTPTAELLHRLGVDFSNAVIRERKEVIAGEALNFRVTHLGEHPLFNGLSRFGLYGGWALMQTADNAEIVAYTSSEAWADLDGDRKLSAADAVQAFGVCVAGSHGYGQFVIFGDDGIFQNRFMDGDNRRLAANLATWLGGDPAAVGDRIETQGLYNP